MSKATELADELERCWADPGLQLQSAAELRRLDAEVEALKGLAETMRKTFEQRIVDAQIVVDKALLENTMLRVCLKNVIKVADRKTDEFDAARAALGETK